MTRGRLACNGITGTIIVLLASKATMPRPNLKGFISLAPHPIPA